MRKFNAILTAAIMVLFLVHAVAGGFQLAGWLAGGSVIPQTAAWAMTVLVGIHTLLGIKLTANTLKAIRSSGASYYKQNRLFWLRRISGLAVMLFLIVHVVIFEGKGEGSSYRLSLFEGVQLASQILLVVSLALHILSNLKPAMLSFGIKSCKELGLDLLVVLSVLLLLMGAAFVVYYLRWNVF